MVKITKHKINLGKILNMLNINSGAINIFIGVVRDDKINGRVKKIYYEVSKKLAMVWLKELVNETKNKFALLDLHVIHRYGWVKVKEVAMVVVAISKHRRQAIKATEYVISKLKEYIPIWKKEVSDIISRWK